MVSLELTREERDVLVSVLQSYLSDLRLEIADTERMVLRDQLKAQEQMINRLLTGLQAAP